MVSAGVGAGHDGAARQLARSLTASGWEVDQWDFLDLLPARTGPLMRASYHRILVLAPSLYQRIHDVTERTGRPGLLQRALLRRAQRRLLRRLPPETRAVVSTYPLASQVLGALRRSGRLAVPAITYLTDFSVHPLWVAPGVDAHLAAHPVPAEEAARWGATGTSVTGPLVDARFAPVDAAGRRAARQRFALPESAALALIVAGSWGVGEVEQVAAEVRDTGAALPVVVCGRNQALRRRLLAAGFDHAYGWVADMPGLMQAADVLVQNAGGLTSLEAFASGLPVASYRCIPGHGRTNAAALHRAGLAVWVRGPEQLEPLLAELVAGPLGHRQRTAALALFAPAADPARAVVRAATTAPAVPSAPVSQGRRRIRRRAAAAAVLATALWAGTGGMELAVAHGGFDAVKATGSRSAYLVVHLPAGARLGEATIRELVAAHAALAVDKAEAEADPAQVQRLGRAGLALVNAGDGPPYSSGVLARRGAVGEGAQALRRDTGSEPAFFLADEELDAVDVGLVRYHGERLVVPDAVLPCAAGAPAPRPGRITLIECTGRRPADLAAALRGVLARTHPSTPLGTLTDLAHGVHR